jgi:prolyl oligopeptidase
MIRHLPRRTLVALALAIAATQVCAVDLAPPDTRTDATVDTFFGEFVFDPYRWLEQISTPEVLDWFVEQNNYARRVLDALPGRSALVARLTELNGADVRVKDVQIAGDDVFYLKHSPGDASYKLYARQLATGSEQLVLDPEQHKLGDQIAAIDYFQASPNGKRVAYGVSLGGSEASTLHVIDVNSHLPIGAPIPRARGATPAWRFDSEILFYTQQREDGPDGTGADAMRHSRTWMRTYGTDGKTADMAILGSGLNPAVKIDGDDTPSLEVSPVSPFAIGIISHGVQNEVSLYVAPLAQLRGAATPWRKLAGREQGITDFALRGEWIYLLTHDHASRFRILRWSLKDPRPYSAADAEVVVAPSEQVIRSLAVAKDALYVQTMEAGYGKLLRLEYNVKVQRAAAPVAKGKTRKSARGTATSLPKFAGIARGSELRLPLRGAIEELDTDPLRPGALLRLSSWTDAPGYFSVDGKSGVVSRTPLLPPAKADFGGMTSAEMMVKSHDGVDVPLSMVYPKNVARDGTAPLLIEAYGAYGINEDPMFWPALLVWLEHGGVYAVAHVRGGGELGEDWHRGGVHKTKANSWRDLIAVAQWLVDARWTAPSRLAIIGGSAGGLTVTNAMLARPDLFAAVVSEVGFHDALRSETGVAGPPNIPEFGTVTTEDGFRELLAMSSYARVQDGVSYPAVLLTTGLHDARVDAWDPAKMTARLQAASTSSGGSGKPVLLRVDFAGGHGGGTTVQIVDENADLFAFLLWRTGAPGFELP